MPAELVVHQINNAVSDGTFKKKEKFEIIAEFMDKKMLWIFISYFTHAQKHPFDKHEISRRKNFVCSNHSVRKTF